MAYVFYRSIKEGRMDKEYNITTVIPARAGSKRLANKNTRLLCGRPMIEYTIEAAQHSRCIRGLNVVVSTNDSEVMRITGMMATEMMREGKQVGVPYIRKRPERLGADNASQVDVIIDSVAWLEEMGVETEWVVLLQPTSPLRSAEDIDKALETMIMSNAHSLVSVSEAQEAPCDMMDFSGRMIPIKKDVLHLFLNGAIYITRYDHLVKQRTFYTPSETLLYFMPKWRGIDVDDEGDFLVADYIMRGVLNGKLSSLQ